MKEIALVLFTICIQASIGIMVFAAVAKLLNKESSFKSAIITAAGLAIVGLLASFMHLGRPLSAINALSQFGSSWLSLEIWFTSAFTGLTALVALLIYVKPSTKSAINALIPIAAVIGLANVFVMASIYNFTSVPAWQHSSIFMEFYAAAISMGAVLFIVLSGKKVGNMRRTLAFTIGVAVILQVVAMELYYIQLGANESLAAQTSFTLLNNMSTAMALKWLLILFGSGLLFLPTMKAKTNVLVGQAATEVAATTEETLSTTTYIAAALIIIGQIIGRYIFYAISITGTIGLS
ncbi:MAG: DMSO reductase [Gracilibacter sp. BRH_c7a]|nr:MAG: DMSO reductase [Gracilibacter sp. BRH_c7a]